MSGWDFVNGRFTEALIDVLVGCAFLVLARVVARRLPAAEAGAEREAAPGSPADMSAEALRALPRAAGWGVPRIVSSRDAVDNERGPDSGQGSVPRNGAISGTAGRAPGAR